MIWNGWPSRRNLPFSTRKEWGVGAGAACATQVRAKSPERTRAGRSLMSFLMRWKWPVVRRAATPFERAQGLWPEIDRTTDINDQLIISYGGDREGCERVDLAFGWPRNVWQG